MTGEQPVSGVGPALRRGWVGYQIRLDRAMAEAGFAERRFPDGRVLRLCRDHKDISISDIGRRLGISRQGAAKVVSGLRKLGYVQLDESATDGRERLVRLTPRATQYLNAQRAAARRIELEIRDEFGAEAFATFTRVLESIAGADPPSAREYVQDRARRVR